MNQAWFYLAGSRQVGPVSLEELQEAVDSGVLHANSHVRPDASNAWCPASQVPGLRPVARATPEASRQADYQGPLSLSANRKAKKSGMGAAVASVGGLALCALVAGAWMVLGGSSAGISGKRAAGGKSAAELAAGKSNRSAIADSAAKSGLSPDSLAPASEQSRATSSQSSRPMPPEASLYQGEAKPTPANKIDELVFAKLKTLGIPPAQLCSDSVFLRRVYLDVIGTLPTIAEVRHFLDDKNPNKRPALIDEVLQRKEYADYWAMRWSDILRIKAEFPINLWPNAAQAYYRWVRSSLKQNMPYDRFVREMLTSCGSNFRVGQVNFYRALQSKKPEPIAKAVALTFMGQRTDNWPKARMAGMSAFFSMIGYKGTAEWKEEIVLFDPDTVRKMMVSSVGARPAAKQPADAQPDGAKPDGAKPAAAAPDPGFSIRALYPDGTDQKWVDLNGDRDPREVFADWLIDPKNPCFSRPIVNRIWCALLGRGIVHEPDDFRPDNPPQNAELLNFLAEELATAHFDQKHIFRLILNSKTYQLSCVPRGKPSESEANFGNYPLRRLEAEVLIDAICQITGTTESYSSAIPEPYTWVPEHNRTITLPDGSITSSFLEMFGRPPRDSGMQVERNDRTTAGQRLHMLNSTHIRKKIQDGPALAALVESAAGDADTRADNLYLAILSRYPSDEERSVVRSTWWKDVAWALMNTTEFFYRH